MPAELAHPVPARSATSCPTPEDRWAKIAIEIHCIRLIAKYLDQDDQRTKENDAEAMRSVCEHSSNIFDHIEACPVVAAGFAQETRVILYRLALVHREHIAKQPPPPPPRKSASRDPRKRLPSPPEPVTVATAEPHKDLSNDGGAARSHARRAPLVAQPYQRSARPTARKQKKVEDVEDVPEAIAASVRADEHEQLPMVLGSVSIADLTTPSLDDLCALFGSTSLSAPAASAAEDAPCDPAPAGANRDAYLPTHTHTPTPTLAPAAPRSCVRAKSVPPPRMNPLDRSGRRRGKTAQL